MSCTVLALPYALAWVVGTVVATTAAIKFDNDITVDSNDILRNLNSTNDNCEDVHMITEKHFIEKDFDTPFVEKSLLIKTLEEHGVKNISESDNYVSGQVENYTLNFSRDNTSEPYKLRISCLQSDNAEEKLSDLGSEYAMNVQEDAYLHIIEKLKENNMQIEEEEVQDDNTIVLTVNID